VSGTLAVEGEFVYGGTVATPQFTFFDEKARDMLLSGLLRYQPPAMSRLALVGGGGIAWTRTWEDPAYGSRPAKWWSGATLTGGVEVAVFNGVHAALAPMFRVRWVRRADSLDGWNGLGAVSVHLGATVILR
jgi:hypothetical protein